MKTVSILFTWFLLTVIVVGLAVAVWMGFAEGGRSIVNGQHLSWAAKFVIGILGIVFGVLALAVGFVATALALAGSILAVVLALALTGLILLAVAMPFLLPVIVPMAAIFICVLVALRSNRKKPA